MTDDDRDNAQVVIRNVGDGESPSTNASLTVRVGDGQVGSAENATDPLAPGEKAILDFPATHDRTGLVTITVEIDPRDEVDEAVEDNNQARRSHVVVDGHDDRPGSYIVLERPSSDAHPTQANVQAENDSLTLSGDSDIQRALVHLPWLQDRFGLVGSPEPFGIVERADTDYAVIEDDSLLTGEQPAFQRTSLEDGSLYTVGSPQSVALDERAMQVELLKVPSRDRVETSTTTENGTVQSLRYENVTHRLVISFQAANTTGQPVRLNATWLQGYGIESPVVEHEDGTRVPVHLDDDQYLLLPNHFSSLYVFDGNDEGYNTEIDRTYSEVSWNPTSEKIEIFADRRDDGDEIFSKDLPGPVGKGTKFTMTVDDWLVDDQGNWQNAYPLVVADDAVSDVDQDPMSFYIRYKSRGSNSGDNPHYIARYVDDTGDRHRLFKYTNGDVNTSYELELSYTPGFRELYAEIRGDVDGLDNDGTVFASGTHKLSTSEGLNLDKIAHATRGTSNTEEPQIHAFVDNVGVEIEDLVIGDAGLTTGLTGDEWLTEQPDQVTAPKIFATTQTTNGGADPSQIHVDRGLSSFDIQHCEWDPNDICDGHNDETAGWVAFDPAHILRLKGMDAGIVETDKDVAADTEEIHLTDRIEHTPLVFAQTISTDGAQVPRNVQVHDRGLTTATIEFCEHETDDSCDKHTSELVNWWAIDPVDADRGTFFDWGTVTSGDHEWRTIDYSDRGWTSAPAVIAMVQTENGLQEALYSEVDDVTENTAKVRVCEGFRTEGTDPENQCDTHADETVAWVAIARKGPDNLVLIDNDEPPSACFVASNDEREIAIDASCSDDEVTSDADLQARVDWDDDGVYERGWSTSLTASHQYSTSGTKTITVQVKDEAADVDTVVQNVVATLSPDACVETSTTDLTVNADASCSSDDLSFDSELQVRWNWTQDDTWDTGWSTPRDLDASHTYQDNGDKTLTVEVRDEHGETSPETATFLVNQDPVADWTHSTANLNVSTNGSDSFDPDGDPIEFSWEWDDGTSDSSGETASHNYDVCPSGTFHVTLTVTDSFGATDSLTREVNVEDIRDVDGDAAVHCREKNQGTSLHDPDTDADGLNDTEEGSWFSERTRLFCGSVCSFPDPTESDIYLEVDEFTCQGTSCPDLTDHEHEFTANMRDRMESKYANHSVNLHIDDGQLGGGQDLVETGHRQLTTIDQLEHTLHTDNASSFDPARQGIYHQMIFAHQHISGPSNVFNNGNLPSDWTVAGGGENDLCGSSSDPRALAFDGSGDRFAETPPLDATGGGFVVFDLKYGDGSGNCETVDAELIDQESVKLEYSTDSGTTWTQMENFILDELENGVWLEQDESIPSDAQTGDTIFRWIQDNHDEASGDNWAIDDVTIGDMPCATAERSDDFSVIGAHGIEERNCDAADNVEDDFVHIALHELGHNYMGRLLPTNDRYTTSVDGCSPADGGVNRGHHNESDDIMFPCMRDTQTFDPDRWDHDTESDLNHSWNASNDEEFELDTFVAQDVGAAPFDDVSSDDSLGSARVSLWPDELQGVWNRTHVVHR